MAEIRWNSNQRAFPYAKSGKERKKEKEKERKEQRKKRADSLFRGKEIYAETYIENLLGIQISEIRLRITR